MITKSLIILSLILNVFGLDSQADKLDQAVVRDRVKISKEVSASKNSYPLPEIVSRPQIKMSATRASANARYYLLADYDSGAIVAKEDENIEVPIASTTKIMTALLVLENYGLDEIVTVSETAANQIGADTFLRPEEQISVESLLNCLLIKSGNDSAYALAEHMNQNGSTGIKSFVKKMNERASELGMKNTEYRDPAGLDVSGYSTARDLFVVTKEALKHEKFREIVSKESEAVKNVDGTIWHELKNSNRLVAEYKYPGAIGVKTGYMPEAGHCLVGAAERQGHTLIAVVLSTYADTPSASAEESRRLLDWGFANLYWN